MQNINVRFHRSPHHFCFYASSIYMVICVRILCRSSYHSKTISKISFKDDNTAHINPISANKNAAF